MFEHGHWVGFRVNLTLKKKVLFCNYELKQGGFAPAWNRAQLIARGHAWGKRGNYCCPISKTCAAWSSLKGWRASKGSENPLQVSFGTSRNQFDAQVPTRMKNSVIAEQLEVLIAATDPNFR